MKLIGRWILPVFFLSFNFTQTVISGLSNLDPGILNLIEDTIPKLWGTENARLQPDEWKAFWIWRRGENQGTNLLLLARKSFKVETQPEHARLFISADNYYELYVNGKFVNRGPARCQPSSQSYDVLNITSLIKPGDNVLAVRVLHQGKFGSYNTPPRPGFIAQLEIRHDGKQEIIITDDSWQVKKPDWPNLSSPVYGEIVDFRRADTGWQMIDYNDSGWQPAENLLSDKFWPWPEPSPEALPKTITFPWITLTPRDIPYMKESLVKATNLFESGEILELGFNNAIASGANGLLFPLEKSSVSNMESYKKGEGPAIIKNGYPSDVFGNEDIYSTYLIYDLGNIMHGYPHLEIEGNAGTIIEILYSPNLLRGKFPLRPDISGRALSDRIILSKGKTTWDALEMKYMRYMLIAFRNTDTPVRLHFAGLKKADYPFIDRGNLSVTEDKEIEWLWKAATNTLRAVTTDAFTDNYRESLQYAQTSYYASRAGYYAFGDSYLQRRYLKQIAELQQTDGVLPAAAPVTGYRGGRFLDASVFWIMGLHDYLLYTGDTSTVISLLPNAEKILERFRIWENKDGIIDSPPYPYWIDHADLDRYGANFSFNSLYLLAMQDFAVVAEWLGSKVKSEEYKKRADNLRINLRTKFWDPEQKLFCDTRLNGVRSEKFSEQSNSLAIVAGIADSDQQREIVKEFVENKSARMVPAVLFMHYISEALFMSGHGNDALKLLRERYRKMYEEGSGTLWEDWGLTVTKRSGEFVIKPSICNIQAENTYLAHSLPRWLLSVVPSKPGMKEVIVTCNFCGLSDIKGSIPTPYGNISVSWKETKKGKYLQLEVPEGIRAFADLKKMGLKNETISLDGKNLNITTIPDEKLEIPRGKHTLIL
jgi:alpha-L-rhamnosidase